MKKRRSKQDIAATRIRLAAMLEKMLRERFNDPTYKVRPEDLRRIYDTSVNAACGRWEGTAYYGERGRVGTGIVSFDSMTDIVRRGTVDIVGWPDRIHNEVG